jgi:hypothetical protein
MNTILPQTVENGYRKAFVSRDRGASNLNGKKYCVSCCGKRSSYKTLERSDEMTYEAFREVVKAKGWTIRVLRSDDAPPSDDLLALMDQVGLGTYEQYVLRLEREQGGDVRKA